MPAASSSEMTPTSAEKVRRQDLDRAKGLAILLVVFGHIVAREPPGNNEWFMLLHEAVYQFHMPFFMYLSGYVTFLSGAASTEPRAWPRLLAKRAARLLLPFFLFGLVIVVGKFVAAKVVYVDNLPGSITEAMFGLLWDTDRSPATSVWYIAVLFAFCVMTPPLIWLDRGKLYAVLSIAAVLYLLPVPHVMYSNRIASYFIFFALGLLAAKKGEYWLRIVDSVSVVALINLVIALWAVLSWKQALPDSFWLLVCGVISMPALHGLVRRRPLSDSDMLIRLGALSFVIYLLNTVFIGLAKGLLLKVMPWDGANFFVFAPILMVAGLFGPIVAKRLLFSHVRVLDRMTD